jgi:hypothetical protein
MCWSVMEVADLDPLEDKELSMGGGEGERTRGQPHTKVTR